MTYREWHTTHRFEIPRIEKSGKLSSDEITEARSLIALYNKQQKTATQTIGALQNKFHKLADQRDAARVYWTESKRMDTQATTSLSADLGFDTFKVILSPNACTVCRKKTQNGGKIFKTSELQKAGYGHAPPFHPNCYCIVVPHVD